MIKNLESHFLPREPQAAVDFLLGLAKVKSLKMTLKFLASKDKATLAHLLEKLRGMGLTNFSAVDAAFS